MVKVRVLIDEEDPASAMSMTGPTIVSIQNLLWWCTRYRSQCRAKNSYLAEKWKCSNERVRQIKALSQRLGLITLEMGGSHAGIRNVATITDKGTKFLSRLQKTFDSNGSTYYGPTRFVGRSKSLGAYNRIPNPSSKSWNPVIEINSKTPRRRLAAANRRRPAPKDTVYFWKLIKDILEPELLRWAEEAGVDFRRIDPDKCSLERVHVALQYAKNYPSLAPKLSNPGGLVKRFLEGGWLSQEGKRLRAFVEDELCRAAPKSRHDVQVRCSGSGFSITGIPGRDPSKGPVEAEYAHISDSSLREKLQKLAAALSGGK